MADDDRRAEIEAVARASGALDEVVAYFDDGRRLPPAGFPLASVVRPAAEGLRAILDRVRDARGDDHDDEVEARLLVRLERDGLLREGMTATDARGYLDG